MAVKLKVEALIVGSGFCGFTAYEELRSKGVRALVVEGGGLETPKDLSEQKYYNLPLVSKYCSSVKGRRIEGDIDPSFRDRKFTLGGSSECWSGWIKPLEETTYSNSYDSSPPQGWGGLSLAKYDERCLRLLRSPIIDFNPYTVANSLGFELPSLPSGLYYSVYAWAKDPLRLKHFWREKIARSPNQVFNQGKDVLVGYRLVSFDISPEGTLSSLVFTNSDNHVVKIEADSYIIAMGGIENARFSRALLNAQTTASKSPEQIIGRFQEHPHLYNIIDCDFGKIQLPSILTNLIPVKANGGLFINDGMLQIAIVAWNGKGTPKAGFLIQGPSASTGPTSRLKNFLRPLAGRKRVDQPRVTVTARCEQRPVTSSRIIFSKDNQDLSLDWRVDPLDFREYSEYLRKYSTFMVSEGFFRDVRLKEPSVSATAIPSLVKGGAHHMSTVPYAADGSGLVDQDFRLAGHANVYVVGSSSFPTSGFENPTVAAMATAYKAAEAISNSK